VHVLDDGICVTCQPHELVDGECVTCSRTVARFNPAEPREPHSGKWVKGSGHEVAKKLLAAIDDGDDEEILKQGELLDKPTFDQLAPRERKDIEDEFHGTAVGKAVPKADRDRAQKILDKLHGKNDAPTGHANFDEKKFSSATSGQAARRAMTYNSGSEDRLDDHTFGTLTGRQVKNAIIDYGDNGFDMVNPHLRELGGRPDRFPDKLSTISGYAGKLHYSRERAETIADGLDAVFAESKTTEPIVVSRGMTSLVAFGSRAHSDMTGVSFIDHGYTSTSVKANASAEFTGNGAGVAMRIHVPKGTPAISSHNLDRDEILLGRGLTYTIVRDRTVKGVRILDVEVSA
jgi:hypothetical protein